MERKTASWPIVTAVVVAVLAPLGLYVGGYFALSKCIDHYSALAVRVRHYDANWMAIIYGPASRIEQCLIGREVIVAGPFPGNT